MGQRVKNIQCQTIEFPKVTDSSRRKCTKEEEFLRIITSPDLSRIAPVFLSSLSCDAE